MTGKAALIIIFNHRFDKNIPVLEEMYRHRFSNIFHLVPFYDGDRPNVIPVYENSYYFQGYIAQGLQRFYKEEFDHYIFIGDDLILNPAINEYNYGQHFSLDKDTSFIPEFFELPNFSNNNTLRFTPHKSGEKKLYWWRVRDAARYKHWQEGVENGKEMPGYAEAEAILKDHGFTMQPLKFLDLYGPFQPTFKTRGERRQVLRYIKWLLGYKKEYKLAYPMVASYSDIVIVAKPTIKKFARYCGVLATNKLFVELALPTALLLSSKKIITEPLLGKRGAIYWTYTEAEAANYEAALKPYSKDLSRLLQQFPEEKLYLHPVKLSQWKTAVNTIPSTYSTV